MEGKSFCLSIYDFMASHCAFYKLGDGLSSIFPNSGIKSSIYYHSIEDANLRHLAWVATNQCDESKTQTQLLDSLLWQRRFDLGCFCIFAANRELQC